MRGYLLRIRSDQRQRGGRTISGFRRVCVCRFSRKRTDERFKRTIDRFCYSESGSYRTEHDGEARSRTFEYSSDRGRVRTTDRTSVRLAKKIRRRRYREQKKIDIGRRILHMERTVGCFRWKQRKRCVFVGDKRNDRYSHRGFHRFSNVRGMPRRQQVPNSRRIVLHRHERTVRMRQEQLQIQVRRKMCRFDAVVCAVYGCGRLSVLRTQRDGDDDDLHRDGKQFADADTHSWSRPRAGPDRSELSRYEQRSCRFVRGRVRLVRGKCSRL